MAFDSSLSSKDFETLYRRTERLREIELQFIGYYSKAISHIKEILEDRFGSQSDDLHHSINMVYETLGLNLEDEYTGVQYYSQLLIFYCFLLGVATESGNPVPVIGSWTQYYAYAVFGLKVAQDEFDVSLEALMDIAHNNPPTDIADLWAHKSLAYIQTFK